MYFQNKSYLDFLISKLPKSSLYRTIGGFPTIIRRTQLGYNHLSTLPGFMSTCNEKALIQFINEECSNEHNLTSYLQLRGCIQAGIDESIICKKRTQEIAVIKTSDNFNSFINSCSRSTRQRLKKCDISRYYVKKGIHHEFIVNYTSLSKIKGFSNTYAYTEEDFNSLVFDDFFYPITVLDEGDNFVGGAIIGIYNNTYADYILSSYSSKILNAGRLLIYFAQKHTYENGFPHLNLGGGTSENDSLMDYKMSFGSVRMPVNYFKLIYDPLIFERIYKRNCNLALEESFFPPQNESKE